MDYISNRAIMIGVGIFVTIAITSSIFVIIGQMQDVYKNVYETDISIQDRFNEFDMYNNTTKTGVDLLNASRKYKDDPLVKINYNGAARNNASGINYIETSIKNGSISYDTKFSVTLEIYKGNDLVNVYFTK